MTNAKPPIRRPAAGINLVITAASLSLTMGGWAILTANDQAVATALATPPAPLAQAAVPASSGLDLPELPPLPTVVPPRAPAAAQGIPAAPAARPRQAAPAAAPRAAAPAAPRRVAPPPAPAAAPAAPAPPPAASTRSSR